VTSDVASIYIYCCIQYTALDLVLRLAMQISSFTRVQLWRFHLSHATPRQRQIQHLQIFCFLMWDDGHCPKFHSRRRIDSLNRMRQDTCVTESLFSLLHFCLPVKISQFAAFNYAMRKIRNRCSFYLAEQEREVLVFWLLKLVVKIMTDEFNSK
jgi:hypothetical protein